MDEQIALRQDVLTMHWVHMDEQIALRHDVLAMHWKENKPIARRQNR
jgi:hypothetical protein